MATQTYVKSGSGYTASVVFSGADADNISGDYQVYVSAQHEWGYPLFDRSKLVSNVIVGDTILAVDDETGFSAGDKIIFQDGTEDCKTVDSVSAGSIVLTTALTRAHNAGTNIGAQRLATRTAANNYEYTLTASDLSSSGVHKIKWNIIQSGVSTFVNQNITVYRQYIDEGQFFDTYSSLETDFGDLFDVHERIIREVINTVCGQTFEYYPTKTISVEGTDSNKLHMPLRVEHLLEVMLGTEEDISSLVQIQNASRHYLQLLPYDGTISNGPPRVSKKPTFSEDAIFNVKADWGWEVIPDEITQAAGILIADRMNDDTAYTRHGIVETYMDTHRIRYDATILGTTGNIEADMLLMDYTLFVIGEI